MVRRKGQRYARHGAGLLVVMLGLSACSWTTSAPSYPYLRVDKIGPGTVASSTLEIYCDESCMHSFEQGATVVLTATPERVRPLLAGEAIAAE